MEYTRVTFENVSAEVQDVLIALLSDKCEGFEEGETNLIAYINHAITHPKVLQDLATRFNLSYTIDQIPERNWNSLWESNFEPVVVDDFCAIRADFHAPITNVQHEIIITPKMSFGTGHHATTYMMIEQMKNMHFRNKKVLDFGTGTGVLAILAFKLNAATVYALDNDEWSIRNAAENFRANNAETIILDQANSAEKVAQTDIILANITRNVIVDNFPYFINNTTPNASILLSGLLEEDEKEISDLASHYQLQLENKMHRQKWTCLLFRK